MSTANPQINKLRILLVEDSYVNREVALSFLQEEGITPDTAVNGAEAVDKARMQKYDIILMDCHTPIMDGYKATAGIRSMPGGDIPIIIALTANTLPSERAYCLSCGMDDYISKPLTREKLVKLLTHWSQKKRSPTE